MAAVWSELQKELASQVSTGKQIIAEQSGHGIHFDQPELVIDVIREMVIQRRHKHG